MKLVTSADVLVIGAGPAGMAAATAAAEHGRDVLVLDENGSPGGQIWREAAVPPSSRTQKHDMKKQRMFERLQCSGAQVLTGRTVFNASTAGLVETLQENAAGGVVERFQYEQLILATGARERFLPFPGWTLPGVFGAGGLQAMVRAGYSIAGRRIVVAGTGPLLPAVAAHLVQDGATVSTIAEQAALSALAAFTVSLWRQPAKLLQGAGYRAILRSTQYRLGTWVLEAIAADDGKMLSAVRMTDGKRTWTEPCDLLACGYHLVPNTELAEVLGCAFHNNGVQVDRQQRTSLSNVFCVGEPTGIAGLEAAMVQGEIAGLTCADRKTDQLQKRARKERAFAQGLERVFSLRQELRSLPQQETIICRCEDVKWSQVLSHSGWSDMKLQTRCGMGPCQGRICGSAVEFLQGWKSSSVRQPVYPVPLHTLCSAADDASQAVRIDI